MKALTIEPYNQSIKEIEIEMQPNTVYTFFSSILIDELPTLERHVVYTDANALSNKKQPFFIGGQIVVGDVLILGRENFEDVSVTIPQKDLETLINYDVPKFYEDVLELLSQTDVNLYRPFFATHNDQSIQLNTEWVLYTFNMADERTKDYFINELQKVIQQSGDVEANIVKMANIALKAAG